MKLFTGQTVSTTMWHVQWTHPQLPSWFEPTTPEFAAKMLLDPFWLSRNEPRVVALMEHKVNVTTKDNDVTDAMYA